MLRVATKHFPHVIDVFGVRERAGDVEVTKRVHGSVTDGPSLANQTASQVSKDLSEGLRGTVRDRRESVVERHSTREKA